MQTQFSNLKDWCNQKIKIVSVLQGMVVSLSEKGKHRKLVKNIDLIIKITIYQN